ncbi:DUF1330 domain-containing protein [Cellvibrio japonicus]|uniref:Uncharacterized protein n=1 Tax=Cellvibrio japonicus (strain Ueda107) TaxID=498211 RepID=B3PE00_CELJU|nr:DUF1330 domain-containing protein [Cellvibrio japonicus]ACE83657.1 hypothetical protein CJA_3203 [Cellvibrio japonicus Ueda107]QEI13484.1 DUF1330 domain-containing protein [Cellvibrio japonicus]QEI17058.1 DUF1330 domain-containing protein [Cellvibrio japonicus]QEI20636.1 DUF1330 domain-containing protein [Cellvibrio japonicus]
MRFPEKIVKLILLFSLSLSVSLQASVIEKNLTPGQRLTIVFSENKPGGEDVQKKYFEQAFPLAQAAGMQEITTFKVEKTLAGPGKPEGSGLYSWPSKEASQKSRQNPQYLKDIKPLRGLAWNELQSTDVDITAPLALTLDKEKRYTIALLWLQDKAAYKSYFSGTQALRDKLGIKTIFALTPSRHETIAAGETTPPDLAVLLEWPQTASTDDYVESPEFQAHHEQFKKGVADIRWFQLGFWN